MRASSLFLAFSTAFATLAAAAYVAVLAADFLEDRSARATQAQLDRGGHDWAVVDVDGLMVRLTGVAESEAMRFAALTAAGQAVDASRILDRMEVVEAAPAPPAFAIEILRNGETISIIGLVPSGMDADHVLALLRRDGAEVTDLLESADFPIPAGMETASDFAARAALRLKRAKISVSPDRVSVSASVDDPSDRARLQSELARLASDSFVLALDIAAPRPVVTPFSLRFVRENGVGRFDVCTADTDPARDRIRKAAVRAGLTGKAECTVGLGSPSPRWAEAAEAAIGALAAIGEGSVTISDADITLIAAAGTDPSAFDTIAGELDAGLPPVFSLHAVPPPEPSDDRGDAARAVPEFLATLSPEGYVQLRGRVANDLMRDAITGFAAARFGSDKVHVATRPDRDLPDGWPVRVLAAIDGLSRLSNGSAVVQPESISIRGRTGDRSVSAAVAQMLTAKLGGEHAYHLKIDYSAALDPLAALPTPEECVDRIQGVQKDAKISFEPGKATIDAEGLKIIDRLAEAWADCEAVPIEIAGHTDSQGRESMNLTLSQTRAEAVVDALLARRVLTSAIIAKGYGETSPIADNATEEGREANRRIEFRPIDEAAITAARRALLATDEGEGEDEQN